jgi:hypothetical protein
MDMMILLGTQLVNKLIQQSIPVAAGYQSRTSAPMNQAVVMRSMQERLDEEGLCRSRYQLQSLSNLYMGWM